MENRNMMDGFEPMESTEAFEDHELGWDDEIENDSSFIILPEGDYDFVVDSFERARYAGGDKIPACNKAIVYIKVKGKDIETGREGETTIKHQLLLHSKLEGMLCEFFTGIGHRKRGEKLKMNWNMVAGCTGKAKIGIKEYNGKKYNEIKKFYDPSTITQQTPRAPQQVSFNKQGGF